MSLLTSSYGCSRLGLSFGKDKSRKSTKQSYPPGKGLKSSFVSIICANNNMVKGRSISIWWSRSLKSSRMYKTPKPLNGSSELALMYSLSSPFSYSLSFLQPFPQSLSCLLNQQHSNPSLLHQQNCLISLTSTKFTDYGYLKYYQ